MLQPACTAYEPRPLWFRIFCMAVILSGKQPNGDTTRAYSVSCSSKTPDANMRSPYGDTLHRVRNEKIDCHRFSGIASQRVEWVDPNIEQVKREAPSLSFLQEKQKHFE